MYESVSCGGPLCSLLDFQVTNLTIDDCVETHSLSLPCLSKMVSSQSHLHELFILVCSSADFALPLQSSGRLYATFAGDDYHYYLFRFPQLPACSLYLSTELQADITTLI